MCATMDVGDPFHAPLVPPMLTAGPIGKCADWAPARYVARRKRGGGNATGDRDTYADQRQARKRQIVSATRTATILEMRSCPAHGHGQHSDLPCHPC